MMTTLKKHFVYQADYQHWANDALFATVDVLDETARQDNQGMVFENIHKTLNHILLVTRNWMLRLKGDSLGAGREELYVADWKELKNALRLEFREAQRWLEAQPEDYLRGADKLYRHTGPSPTDLGSRCTHPHHDPCRAPARSGQRRDRAPRRASPADGLYFLQA